MEHNHDVGILIPNSPSLLIETYPSFLDIYLQMFSYKGGKVGTEVRNFKRRQSVRNLRIPFLCVVGGILVTLQLFFVNPLFPFKVFKSPSYLRDSCDKESFPLRKNFIKKLHNLEFPENYIFKLQHVNVK